MYPCLLSAQLFSQIKYPESKKVNQVDDYFGTKVADPYRWLEDDNSEETKQWVEAENKITDEYLSSIPFYDEVKKKGWKKCGIILNTVRLLKKENIIITIKMTDCKIKVFCTGKRIKTERRNCLSIP